LVFGLGRLLTSEASRSAPRRSGLEEREEEREGEEVAEASDDKDAESSTGSGDIRVTE